MKKESLKYKEGMRDEPSNKDAVDLGLLGEKPSSQSADRYYDLLHLIEKMFDGNLDQSKFEDAARSMFGLTAYHVFNLDKIIQSFVKHVLRFS